MNEMRKRKKHNNELQIMFCKPPHPHLIQALYEFKITTGNILQLPNCNFHCIPENGDNC